MASRATAPAQSNDASTMSRQSDLIDRSRYFLKFPFYRLS
ncbi:hypothetical protein M6B38_345125 [Iris pallida]|uniref:Uncharacterized protein n=1 Tax=Iris pallida TaxID=29817 RepID=A0AAX6FRH4_IRIPA|nr:hypothetical protein M6B38_405885 [Iris pallida]KAJ6832014.1 hypothetical protein M6B38_345125 [Iris pallida]